MHISVFTYVYLYAVIYYVNHYQAKSCLLLCVKVVLSINNQAIIFKSYFLVFINCQTYILIVPRYILSFRQYILEIRTIRRYAHFENIMQATYTRIFRCHFYFLQTKTAITLIADNMYATYIHYYSDVRPKRSKILMQQIFGLYIRRLRTSVNERLKVVKKRFFSAFPFHALFMRFMWSKWKKSAFLEKSGFMPF